MLFTTPKFVAQAIRKKPTDLIDQTGAGATRIVPLGGGLHQPAAREQAVGTEDGKAVFFRRVAGGASRG